MLRVFHLTHCLGNVSAEGHIPIKGRHNIIKVLVEAVETYLSSLAAVCGDAERPNLPTR